MAKNIKRSPIQQVSAAQRQKNNQLLFQALSYVHSDIDLLIKEAGAYLAWKNESPSGSPMGAALEDLGNASPANAWSYAYASATADSDEPTAQYRNRIKQRYATLAHQKVLEVGLMHLPLTINSVIKMIEEPIRLDDYEER